MKTKSAASLSPVVSAALALDRAEALHYRVGFSSVDAVAFLGEAEPWLVDLVIRVVGASPSVGWWQDRIAIGREFGRVIYFNIGLGRSDADALVAAIEKCVSEFNPDEVDFCAATGLLRIWWD